MSWRGRTWIYGSQRSKRRSNGQERCLKRNGTRHRTSSNSHRRTRKTWSASWENRFHLLIGLSIMNHWTMEKIYNPLKDKEEIHIECTALGLSIKVTLISYRMLLLKTTTIPRKQLSHKGFNHQVKTIVTKDLFRRISHLRKHFLTTFKTQWPMSHHPQLKQQSKILSYNLNKKSYLLKNRQQMKLDSVERTCNHLMITSAMKTLVWRAKGSSIIWEANRRRSVARSRKLTNSQTAMRTWELEVLVTTILGSKRSYLGRRTHYSFTLWTMVMRMMIKVQMISLLSLQQ